MRAVLAKGGWDIRHTADGRDAVRLAVEWEPALILLDVGLPGMDGFQVCSAVRASETGDAPLIVMVTSNDDLSSKLRGFAEGADDYLVKPIDPQELFTRVSRLMGARAARAREIAQRRRDAIHEIVTTICHELNSPLTAALGYLELAIKEPELLPQHREDLGSCRVALDRMIDIIERLRKVDDHVVPYVGDLRMIDLPQGAGGGGQGEGLSKG